MRRRTVLICLLLALALGGCAGHGLRCETGLEPINAPSPATAPPAPSDKPRDSP